jgi:hypothetical protein
MITSTARVRPIEFNASAVGVTFDDDSLHIALADGREIAAPLAYFPALLNATSEQRAAWVIVGGGYGIHWDELDEQISVRGIMRIH